MRARWSRVWWMATTLWLAGALGLSGTGGIRPCQATGAADATRAVLQRSRAVVAALAADDTAQLATYVQPTRGVRFSPYGFALQDPQWMPRQVAGLHHDTHLYTWGHEPHAGTPLRLTWHKFRPNYLYTANFAASHAIHAFPVTAHTFQRAELNHAFAGGLIVQYAVTWGQQHHSGIYLGMIWQKTAGRWYLTAIDGHAAGLGLELATHAARAKRSRLRPPEENRWDTVAFILSLFAAVIFVPISVEKVVSRQPFVTQTLIALNVCIFLVTVAMANVYLPGDREAGQSLLTHYPAFAGTAGERLALEHAHDPQGFKEVWQMEHAYSDFVLEPHYSVLNRFAYRPAEPSTALKLLGLLGSMFLHGNLLHLAGNMVFLWVFGRALEEKLGHWPYLFVYLLSGICGTLVYHFTTAAFIPEALGWPAYGASGAIAGLLGAFLWRFHRTKVNVLCIPPMSWPILCIAGAIWGAIGYLLFGLTAARLSFGLAVVVCCWLGPGLFWHIYTLAATWAIGAWLLLFNIAPGLWSLYTGHPTGIAHWAHIGGFAAGLLFVAVFKPTAPLVTRNFNEAAVRRAALYATDIVARDPYNPNVRDLNDGDYERLRDARTARDSYLEAISLYFPTNEYGPAALAYLDLKRQHPGLIVPPDANFMAGSSAQAQTGVSQAWQQAATPTEAQDAAQLVTRARLYLHRLHEAQIATALLGELLRQYPDSPWSQQSQYVLDVAGDGRR